MKKILFSIVMFVLALPIQVSAGPEKPSMCPSIEMAAQMVMQRRQDGADKYALTDEFREIPKHLPQPVQGMFNYIIALLAEEAYSRPEIDGYTNKAATAEEFGREAFIMCMLAFSE